METDRSDCENIESTLEDDRIDNGNAMTADGITDKAEEVGSDAILPQSPYTEKLAILSSHRCLLTLSTSDCFSSFV